MRMYTCVKCVRFDSVIYFCELLLCITLLSLIFVSALDANTGIRLVNGSNTSGLVEVLHDCEWRSVCDDYWTNDDADVACRQLGFLPYGKCN